MSKVKHFHDGIDYSLKIFGKEVNLKESQYEVLKAVVCEKKDALVVLPTGYGKSLIYQTLPMLFDYVNAAPSNTENAVVIVVSPLNALMQDQAEKLKDKINIAVLKANDVEDDELLKRLGSCQLIFAHPEVLVNNVRTSNLCSDVRFKNKVKAIVVDEAHLIVEWKDFRPAYGKLSLLSSFFPNVPIIALTATATLETKKKLCLSLGLVEPVIVAMNPDRKNIYFASFVRKNTGDDKLNEILWPLALELRKERQNFPLTLIYDNLQTISECFLFFSQTLGMEQYDPPGASALAKNRLFSQFHAQYPEHERKRIVKELTQGESKLRILFVTVSFGIGIDIKDIRQVIHIGLPYTMEEYFQEAGRCGRDGLPAKAIIYYNSYDISSSRSQMSNVMRTFVKEQKCKRKIILDYFGYPVPKRSEPDHTCCDYHRAKCQCDSCLVSHVENIELQGLAVAVKAGLKKDIDAKKDLTAEEVKNIHKALVDYRLTLHGAGRSCVGGISLATGFSMDLINMVMDQATELTSVEEIKARLPVFNNEHAKNIFAIIHHFRDSSRG